MIAKEIKRKFLNYYEDKDEKLFVSSLLDKLNKVETCGYVVHTQFLNQNEVNISSMILNTLKSNWYLYKPFEDTSKFVIFLIPDNYCDYDIKNIIKENITFFKVSSFSNNILLKHRECMGTIYSLGLNEKMIGDIFVVDGICYFFCFKNNEQFFYNNLNKISKYDVRIEKINAQDEHIANIIKVNYENIQIITPSLRVDSILSKIFKLSRSETNLKIKNGNLFINSKEMYFCAYEVKEDDIVSFRKYGKIKIGKIVRSTKSGKIVLEVMRYK